MHDAQTDYYGTRLATCSSDKSVRVFDLKNGTQQLVATLREHDGPVWQVAWAHPMFGTVLASCSYDRKVIIWRCMPGDGKWAREYLYDKHESSVNSICWASHEFGLMLAAGSSDGSVSVHTCTAEGEWESVKIANAHSIGCNAVSWAPPQTPGNLVQSDGAPSTSPNAVKKFVTGGCDNLVKIWMFDDELQQWREEHKLEAHEDWVRDVAWAPCLGISKNMIASCSQDCQVIVWTQDNDKWSNRILSTFDDVIWLVSWSVTGNILAVSGGDNNVSLWREGKDGNWECISDVARASSDPPPDLADK